MARKEPAPQASVESPPPHSIAFLIDGVVQEVLYTHDRFAAILQSDPVIVNATGVTPRIGQTTYDPETGEFSNPDGGIQIASPIDIAL